MEDRRNIILAVLLTIGALEWWSAGLHQHHAAIPPLRYSLTPVLQLPIICLVELHPILLARPFLDEALGLRIDLESLLDGFFQTITAQQRIAS